MDLKYCARYPFSEETKELLNQSEIDLMDPEVLDEAERRVKDLLDKLSGSATYEIPANEKYLKRSIASYGIAKALVSATGNRALKTKYAAAEAKRFRRFLEENPSDIPKICNEMNIKINNGKIPVLQYLKVLPNTEENLVNQEVSNGEIEFHPKKIPDLLAEKLKKDILHDIEQKKELPEEIKKRAQRLKGTKTTEFDYGEVKEGLFPPCIQDIIDRLEKGEKLGHQPRFVLATFMIHVGMPTEEIVEFFSNTPNFKRKKTTYYVKYAKGEKGSGTKYSPPACKKMQHYGLCVNQDRLCRKIPHPLSYYKAKKKRERKKNE